MGVDKQSAGYLQCCDIRGQSNYLYINSPFPNATIEHTKHLRHSRSREFSFTATVLRTLERAHSVSLFSGPLTCKCPPAIRHQQRAARERQEKKH